MRDDVMKVKGNLVAALALGAAVACGAGFAGITPAAAASKDTKNTITDRDVAIPLQAAQKSLKSGDYSGALQQLDKADSQSKKTPYEQFLINEMRGFAYGKTKQYALA